MQSELGARSGVFLGSGKDEDRGSKKIGQAKCAWPLLKRVKLERKDQHETNHKCFRTFLQALLTEEFRSQDQNTNCAWIGKWWNGTETVGTKGITLNGRVASTKCLNCGNLRDVNKLANLNTGLDFDV